MSIEGIYLSPVASGSMKEVEKATLITGKGLKGDRYCDQVGTYSLFRISKKNPGEPEPGRQLTMLSADSVEEALERSGLEKPKSLGDLRRNVVVRGLTADDLLGASGHVVKLGDTCRVLVHRHCVPCMYNERKNGIPGLMEAVWKEAGVSCEVLEGGTCYVGDKVEVLAETMEVDDGHQAPGYYVPPSKRTAEMVVGAIQRMRNTKQELLELDPEGVSRVQASYDICIKVSTAIEKVKGSLESNKSVAFLPPKQLLISGKFFQESNLRIHMWYLGGNDMLAHNLQERIGAQMRPAVVLRGKESRDFFQKLYTYMQLVVCGVGFGKHSQVV